MKLIRPWTWSTAEENRYPEETHLGPKVTPRERLVDRLRVVFI